MKKIVFAFLALLPLIFSGCGRTPIRTGTMPLALPPEVALPAESARRAAEFRKIISVLPVRGIAVYPSAFIGKFESSQVLDMISRLGFNRIYCYLTSEQELTGELEEFVAAAGVRKLEVELVLSQQDFYRAYRGNRLIRGLFIQYPDLLEAVEDAVDFAADLPEGAKISGITVLLTPHLINGNNVQRSRKHLYSWSEKHYGPGGDNDMLMRQSLEYAKKIAALPGLPPLTIAVPDFFQQIAVEKKVSCGSVADFARITPRVAVVNSANRPSQLPVMIKSALDGAPAGSKVLIVLPLAEHTSITADRLRRRHWQDFCNSTAYLVKKSGTHPACGGVIFSPLSIIEYLRLEK